MPIACASTYIRAGLRAPIALPWPRGAGDQVDRRILLDNNPCSKCIHCHLSQSTLVLILPLFAMVFAQHLITNAPTGYNFSECAKQS
ncbi:hypothetical protein CC86DRAFT_31278 [Ophiobolus disseminans]|uniref:Uncharacterized protein n=1 Tax=Ophiobolus disseminans TaxID=1469910 RepID=A0A6A7A060_9PLEO|nr:hypothetical protein CC86DRAFT_31278 [Ophiobolus disseminans]